MNKLILTLIASVFLNTAFAKTFHCEIESSKMETNTTSADTVDLKSFTVQTDGQIVVAGKARANFLSYVGQDLDYSFDRQGLISNADFDLTVDLKNRIDINETRVSLLFDGWDHYHYYININELTKKAKLRGSIEYDCSSGPVNVSAAYSCVVEN